MTDTVSIPIPPVIRVQIPPRGGTPAQEIDLSFIEFLAIPLDRADAVYGRGIEAARRLSEIMAMIRSADNGTLRMPRGMWLEIVQIVDAHSWGAAVNRQLLPFHEALHAPERERAPDAS